MNTSIVIIFFFLALVVRAVPYVQREPCTTDKDCLHGFPATVATLVCSKSFVCEARNPHYCTVPADCKAALTSCVAQRCAHGARGAPCAMRADCGIGQYCSVDGRCLHGARGTTCSTSTAVECADGLTCSTTGKCTPGLYNTRCVLDRNCADGLFCDEGRCADGFKRINPLFFPWGTPPPELPSPPPPVPQPSVEAVLIMATQEPVNALGNINVPELSSVPLIEVTTAPVNAALGEQVPEPSVGLIVDTNPLPLARKMGRSKATEGNGEVTEPVTVVSYPTAIPVPKRTLSTKKNTVAEIIVQA